MGLHGLVKVPGRKLGNSLAVLGNKRKLRPPDGITLDFRLPPGKFRVPARPQHHCLTCENHRFKKRLAPPPVHRAERIERGQARLGFLPDAGKSPAQHLGIVRNPLQGRTIGCRFTDHETGGISLLVIVGQPVRFGRKAPVQSLMKGSAFPVGRYFLRRDADVLLAHVQGRRFPVRKRAQRFVHEIAVQFGIQNAVTPGVGAAAPHNKLHGLHIYRNVLGNMLQRLCPAQHQGLPLCPSHGFREQPSALYVDDRRHAVKSVQNGEQTGMLLPVGVVSAAREFPQQQFLIGTTTCFTHDNSLSCPPLGTFRFPAQSVSVQTGKPRISSPPPESKNHATLPSRKSKENHE